MKVIIVGAGIGGLTAALSLHAAGIDVQVVEQARELGELGVGINVLPHAVKELAELGLLPALERAGIRTRDAGKCDRHVGAAGGQGPLGHRPGAGLAHLALGGNQRSRHAEPALLQLGGVGDRSAQQHFARAGGLRQKPGGEAGDLARRVPPRGANDEVGSLSDSLNRMLAQIEHSFAVREASERKMRDFVADAFAHRKFIAYVPAATPLLEKAGVAANIDDGFIALGKADDPDTFVAECRKLRYWERVGAER